MKSRLNIPPSSHGGEELQHGFVDLVALFVGSGVAGALDLDVPAAGDRARHLPAQLRGDAHVELEADDHARDGYARQGLEPVLVVAVGDVLAEAPGTFPRG